MEKYMQMVLDLQAKHNCFKYLNSIDYVRDERGLTVKYNNLSYNLKGNYNEFDVDSYLTFIRFLTEAELTYYQTKELASYKRVLKYYKTAYNACLAYIYVLLDLKYKDHLDEIVDQIYSVNYNAYLFCSNRKNKAKIFYSYTGTLDALYTICKKFDINHQILITAFSSLSEYLTIDCREIKKEMTTISQLIDCFSEDDKGNDCIIIVDDEKFKDIFDAPEHIPLIYKYMHGIIQY